MRGAVDADGAGSALDPQTDGCPHGALEADRACAADDPDGHVADRPTELHLDPIAATGQLEPPHVQLAEVRLDPVHAADHIDRPGDRAVERDRGDALAPVERNAAVLDEHPAVAHPDLRGRAVKPGAVEVCGRAS